MNLPQAEQGEFEGLDIIGPEIDFVGLAQSLGVEARRVETADQLSDELAAQFNNDRPLLLDVPIARGVGERLNYG